MKRPVAVAAVCTFIAGILAAAPLSIAEQANASHGADWQGHGQGGDGGRWNRGSGVGVVVDLPLRRPGDGDVQSPGYDHCREARTACFESFGIDGQRYGRCLLRMGC